MKQYKEIENGIEYEVFEFEESEQDFEARIIEKYEYSKIIRVYDTYKDIFYFKKGEAHNDYGPAMKTNSTGDVHFRKGEFFSEDEWKAYFRSMMIDRMLSNSSFKPKKLEE